MNIFIHKVQMNPIDGWGRSTGMTTEILGIYHDRETTLREKNKRDSNKDYTCCDIGESWIEEILVE
jgi:hypothetical protein